MFDGFNVSYSGWFSYSFYPLSQIIFFYLFVLDTPEDILESLCKSAEKRWQIKIK